MTITRCRSPLGRLTVGAVLLLAAPASAQSPTFTVDPVAYLSVSPSANDRTFVVVTGTASCDESVTAGVIVSIFQRVQGEDISDTDGPYGTVSCSAGTWALALLAGEFEGPTFKPGKADVVAGLFLDSVLEQLVEVEIVVLPPNAARELEQMSSKTETSTDALQRDSQASAASDERLSSRQGNMNALKTATATPGRAKAIAHRSPTPAMKPDAR